MRNINKKVIGVKFCGGCNPDYSRRNAHSKIENNLSDRYDFVPHNNNEAELIVVLAGCPTACVDISLFSEKKIFIVSEINEIDDLIDNLSLRTNNVLQD